MTISISINWQQVGKLPSDASPVAYNRLNTTFTNGQHTIAEVADAIRAGHAIAPCHDGRRARAHFICAQHVGIDFDGGDMPLDVLARHPLIAQHAALIHTTASHRPEHPRSRALFVLDRPIHNPDKLVELIAAMLATFGTADPMCKDPARLFYGAPGCDMMVLGHVLTLAEAADLFVHPHRARLAEADAARAAQTRAAPARVAVPAGDAEAAELADFAERLLEMVRHAPNGGKHATLRDIARTFGGYVANGYYTRADADAWLRAAIETRRADVRDMAAAYDTIAEGLDYGQRAPLVFERRQRPEQPSGPAGRGRPSQWFAALPRSAEWTTQPNRRHA